MQATRGDSQATISASELKSSRANVTLERLRKAQQEGHVALVVTNKDKPVLQFGCEKDLPIRWKVDEIQRISFSDMRAGKLSLLALRRDRRAIILIQQGKKPALALWPLDDDGAGPSNEATVPTINLEKENALLRRRMTQLEKRVEQLEQNLEETGKALERRFRRRSPGNSE